MAKTSKVKTKGKPNKQVNNYKITFSKTYGVWQVSKSINGKKVIYEEFDLKMDAIRWAKNN